MEYVKPLDDSFAEWVMIIRQQNLTSFLKFITSIGDVSFILFLLVILFFLLILLKKYLPAITLLVSYLGSSATVFILKDVIGKGRPAGDTALMANDGFSSFPSAHAAAAFSFYALIFYLLIIYVRNDLAKLFWGVLAAAIIILLGFSRLYLGLHFLSDVLAGYLVGFIWFFAAVRFLSKRKYSWTGRRDMI